MQAPISAAFAVLVLLLGAVPAAAEDEQLFAGDFVDREALPGVTHEILSDQWVDYGDDHLMQVRTTLAPGAAIPPSVFSGYWASTVESGRLTVLGKGARLVRGKQGPTRVLEPGQTLYASTDDIISWTNRSLVPVEILSVVLFDNDHDPIARTDAVPRFEDVFKGVVVDRIVLEGVRRSGRLTGSWFGIEAAWCLAPGSRRRSSRRGHGRPGIWTRRSASLTGMGLTGPSY